MQQAKLGSLSDRAQRWAPSPRGLQGLAQRALIGLMAALILWVSPLNALAATVVPPAPAVRPPTQVAQPTTTPESAAPAKLGAIGKAAPPIGAAEPSNPLPNPLTVALPNPLPNPLPKPIERGSFVALAVQKVGNAVVRIDTERSITRKSTLDPSIDDPAYRRFFGGELNAPREELQRGQGSGFLIDQSGILLTNSHVVNGADKVTVTLKDGRKFEGKVRGFDEVTDLAVVKIDGQDLPVASLGNSDRIQVGDWAIALGNPLGLDNTVTLGIVSTLNRSSAQIGLSDKRLDFIQTDAAINPGNSGGPLLNDNGEVIGINTAIRADAMGIGFAIPINKAKDLKDQLNRGEHIRHPYLGVQMTTFTQAMAAENNDDPNSLLTLPDVDGVLVLRVLPETPAAKAGIRRYDVITAVDGQPVTTAEQLQQTVENSRLGQSLKVEVQRGGKTQQIAVRTADLKEES
jgi:S1-C subfamily serine protease